MERDDTSAAPAAGRGLFAPTAADAGAAADAPVQASPDGGGDGAAEGKSAGGAELRPTAGTAAPLLSHWAEPGAPALQPQAEAAAGGERSVQAKPVSKEGANTSHLMEEGSQGKATADDKDLRKQKGVGGSSKVYFSGDIPVLTFLPEAPLGKPDVDVFILFHGFYTDYRQTKTGGTQPSSDNPALATDMAAVVAQTSRNLVVMAPTIGKAHYKDASWETLGAGRYTAMVKDVLGQLTADLQPPAPLRLGNVSLAGHSAGGRALGQAAQDLGDQVKDVTLQDAGYGTDANNPATENPLNKSWNKLAHWFLTGAGGKRIRVIVDIGGADNEKRLKQRKARLRDFGTGKALDTFNETITTIATEKLKGTVDAKLQASRQEGDGAARSVDTMKLDHTVTVQGDGEPPRTISVFTMYRGGHYGTRDLTTKELIQGGPATAFEKP